MAISIAAVNSYKNYFHGRLFFSFINLQKFAWVLFLKKKRYQTFSLSKISWSQLRINNSATINACFGTISNWFNKNISQKILYSVCSPYDLSNLTKNYITLLLLFKVKKFKGNQTVGHILLQIRSQGHKNIKNERNWNET